MSENIDELIRFIFTNENIPLTGVIGINIPMDFNIENNGQINIFQYASSIGKKSNKEILSHLPKFISVKKNDTIIGETCTICCDSFILGQFQRKLHICNHTFHKKCIDKWFCNNEYNMVCPLCKCDYSKIN